MDLLLQDKNVLITASSSGIGKAIARAFLQEGANVVLNGRDFCKLNEAVEELHREFSNARIGSFCGDLLEPASAYELREYLERDFSPLHVFVSNLGSGSSASTNPLDANEWRRMFEVNLLSAVHLLDVCVPLLVRDGTGNILLVSSIAGKERIPAPASYSCAKSALLMFVKYFAHYLAPEGIRVNSILPGNVIFAGGRWQELLRCHPNLMDEYIRKEVPLQRLASVEEVAHAVLFLASPLSSFTTGAAIVVDGGQTRSV